MSGDPRLEALVGHVDGMLDVLEGIVADLDQKLEAEGGKPEPNGQLVAFLEDQRRRARGLATLLEEDALGRIIGLNNLSGVIRNFYPEHS